jgi:3-methylcrotonyl-CoA carboxylase alpha subunit
MIRLLCGGRVRELVVRAEAGVCEVRVDGRPHSVRAREIATGSYVLEGDGRCEVFHCVREGEEVHLFWRGVAYRLRIPREGARSATHHAEGGLETPMPGRVVKVSVAPGQVVGKGDEVLIVEAMKMENVLRAPRDGRVLRVTARVGEMVNPGTVLVELE